MIRRFFSAEMKKLKAMNFAEKRQYIWEYYKLHIFFIGFGAFIVGSFINIWFINPPKQDYLYIAWQAGFVHTQPLEELSEKLSVIVHDPERYRVSVRAYVLGEDLQLNQALATRFHALLTTGGVHAIITTSEGIQESAEFGLLKSPEVVLAIIREYDRTLYDKLTERLLTITFEIREEDTPGITDIMAINISGTPMLMDVDLGMDNLYLGVVSNSQQFDGIARALAAMFSFEAEEAGEGEV